MIGPVYCLYSNPCLWVGPLLATVTIHVQGAVTAMQHSSTWATNCMDDVPDMGAAGLSAGFPQLLHGRP
jgi:hypothetical protein